VPSSSPSSPTRTPSTRAAALKPFYVPPGPLVDKDGKPSKRYAPERLVSMQMKVLREQWAGLGLALDLGLVRGDTELAGAVWRNLLGGRAVNLVGGNEIEVRRVNLKGLEKEERADDFSGVRDYRPSEVGASCPLVLFRELMRTPLV
jgi:cytochrome b pre-mRNA-processing protein 3